MTAGTQIGKYNKHINESHGADNNIMKFYITEYSSKHGVDNFQPKHNYHKGTGYNSNFRPGVYYSRKLDELDNPKVGKLLTDNYCSVTHQDYLNMKGSTGKEPLPNDICNSMSSGFVKHVKQTLPSYNQVHPLSASTSKNTSPFQKVEHYDPMCYTTESHSQFVAKKQHVDTTGKTVGDFQHTGFTKSKNLEPLTFRPDNNFDAPHVEKFTFRPTGNTVTQTSYPFISYPNGNEVLPPLNNKASKDTGFTRYILPTGAPTVNRNKTRDMNHPLRLQKLKQQDPAEYSNITCPDPYTTLNQLQYQSKNIHRPDVMLRCKMGDKEKTGYTENNLSYVVPTEELRTDTTYGKTFYDKSSLHVAPLKDVNAAELQSDGYTKSEKLHSMGKVADVSEMLQTLHPYVNRSLKARDPFYGEQKYAHKDRTMLVTS